MSSDYRFTRQTTFAGGQVADWLTQPATKKIGVLTTGGGGAAAPAAPATPDGFVATGPATTGGGGFPVVPVAIGAVAVAGIAAFLLLKKKRR